MARKSHELSLSNDHRLIDESSKKIVEAAKNRVVVPTNSASNKEFTVIRSPHKHRIVVNNLKDVHKRLIDIRNNSKTMETHHLKFLWCRYYQNNERVN